MWIYCDILSTEAATDNHFHYWLIRQLLPYEKIFFALRISSSQIWRLQTASFVRPTVQTSKTFSLKSHKTKKSNKSSHLRSWNEIILTLLLEKWLLKLFIYQNSCRSIINRSINQLNVSGLLSAALLFQINLWHLSKSLLPKYIPVEMLEISSMCCKRPF